MKFNLAGFGLLVALGAAATPWAAMADPTNRCTVRDPAVESGMSMMRSVLLEPGRQLDVAVIMADSDVKALRVREEADMRRDWANLCRYQADDEAIAASERPIAAFMGDSITDNWVFGDPSLFSPGRVGRGVSGQISAQMVLRFYQDIVAVRPKLVHIMAGTNDISGAVEPVSDDDYKNNIQAMTDLALRNGIAVVIGSIPPAASFPWVPGIDPKPRIHTLNVWLRDYARAKRVVFADYDPILSNGAGGIRSAFTNDGVHPNKLGYAAMRPVAEAAMRRAAAGRAAGESTGKRQATMAGDDDRLGKKGIKDVGGGRPQLPAFSEIKEIGAGDAGALAIAAATGDDSCGGEQWFTFAGEKSVRNVGRPSLLPVLPASPGISRTAIIVAPGGGFTALRFQGEGTDVAARLAEQGIAAFVLKYRTRCTPRERDAFIAFFAAEMTKKRHHGNVDFPLYQPAGEDVGAAIAYLRAHAAEFGIDPARIGVLGFSAGAIAAVDVAQRSGTPESADFVMPIYPQLNVAVRVPAHPAPMFVAIAADDDVFGQQEATIVDRWRAGGGSVEFHLYETGGHGFGLGRAGTSSANWFQQLLLWLQANGLADGPTS